MKTYDDRKQAGRELSTHLQEYAGEAEKGNVVVLGLPRGGVPVAHEVARNLHAPLEVYIVRKLGVPGHSELAMGAIASGDVRVLNQDIVRMLHISDRDIARVEKDERRELIRREREYRGEEAPPLDLKGKTVIITDDGLATGASMRAAIQALRKHEPTRIIVAVPTAPPEAINDMEKLADQVVCPLVPHQFMAVGRWYRDFKQTTDREVKELLAKSRSNQELLPVS